MPPLDRYQAHLMMGYGAPWGSMDPLTGLPLSRGKQEQTNGPITLKTNPICPFAHRAAFTAKYRNPPAGVRFSWIPLSGELKKGETSMEEVCKINEFWSGMTIQELNAIKEDYKKTLNASGEVPTVVTPSGDIVMESEIAAEYLDAVGDPNQPSLVPADPVLASKMRLAMKRFNDVVGAGYGILFNKDSEQDATKAQGLREKIEKWVLTLDPSGPFTLGDTPSLADVHAAPFLHRFKTTLSYYRGVNVLENQRAVALCEATEALPGFLETSLPPEKFIAGYSGAAGERRTL